MTKDDCIFCKLANGVFATNMIYEDADFAVILDAAPAARGHALIIPKQHSDNLYELPEETAAKALPLAKKIAIAMKDTFHCDGVNVLQNNELAAGQTVFHFHTHIIPRFNPIVQNNLTHSLKCFTIISYHPPHCITVPPVQVW